MGFGNFDYTCENCGESFIGNPSILLGQVMCIHCGAMNDLYSVKKESQEVEPVQSSDKFKSDFDKENELSYEDEEGEEE